MTPAELDAIEARELERLPIGAKVWKGGINFGPEIGTVCAFEKRKIIVDFESYKQVFEINPESNLFKTESLFVTECAFLAWCVPRMREAAQSSRSDAEFWDRHAQETEDAIKNSKEELPQANQQEALQL